MKGVVRPESEVAKVRELLEAGLSDYEIARRTGIPRSTVLNWRHGRAKTASRPGCPADRCHECGAIHRLEDLDREAECCGAIEAVRGRVPYVRYLPDKRMATISSYWQAWPCLFPQHGPGRKHRRRIVLAPWQESIVEAHPEPFLRGLIDSDGWRGVNRVRVKGRDYEYPRYQFSNRSQDIKDLFTSTCDLLGIEWRPWGRHHISVARRESVALMDEFIGPKW
jgi:hypothetical protein